MVATANGLPTKPLRKGGEFSLARVTSQARKLPNRGVLHAKAGWGKTSFAAQVPGIVFLMIAEETGLWTLMDAGQLPDSVPHFPSPACTKHELETAVAELTVKDHPHKALAIDSGTLIDRFLQQKVCEEKYGGDWDEFNNFGSDKAYKTVAAEWDSILAGLDRLRDRGLGVILLAHTEVYTFKNPEGPDYDRWSFFTNKHSRKRLYDWADMVLFGNYETHVDKANKKKSDAETKGKASGGQRRVLLTQHHAAYDAKNRHGLPEEIDGGDAAAEAWVNFIGALYPDRRKK
jgi:hypothetical protein